MSAISRTNGTITQVMSHSVSPSPLRHKLCLTGCWIWPLSQNLYSFAAHLIFFFPAGTRICQPGRRLWKREYKEISCLCHTQTSLSGTNNHTSLKSLLLADWLSAVEENKHFMLVFLFFQLKPTRITDTRLILFVAIKSSHYIDSG